MRCEIENHSTSSLTGHLLNLVLAYTLYMPLLLPLPFHAALPDSGLSVSIKNKRHGRSQVRAATDVRPIQWSRSLKMSSKHL